MHILAKWTKAPKPSEKETMRREAEKQRDLAAEALTAAVNELREAVNTAKRSSAE